jgi:peptidylprolyl isomerase
VPEAKKGDTVKVHYTGKLEDGTVFDSSQGRQPLEFQLGSGSVIPGFEEAIVGMQEGESKTTQIPADQAYGPYHDEMLLTVPREQFPPDIEPEVGQELELRQQDGQSFVVQVKDVSDGEVTLDANHPLAGEDLTFDIQLVQIAA